MSYSNSNRSTASGVLEVENQSFHDQRKNAMESVFREDEEGRMERGWGDQGRCVM